MTRQIYYIKGMHCASCELSIEKKILEFSGVSFADASLAKGEVVFDYQGQKPSLHELNHYFSGRNYIFAEQPNFGKNQNLVKAESGYKTSALLPAVTIIIVFLLLEKFGLSGLVNVTASASWPVFLTFGIIAGLSSCAALVGGLLLSLSKQWQEQYNKEASKKASWEPSLMFNLGRVVSYSLLGLALGFVGQKFQFSPVVNSFLVILISVLMTALSLQMLGVKSFQRFKLALPKSLTRKVASGPRGQNRLMPAIFGFLTFLLPCGFTLMVEGFAVLSGDPVRAAMMMGAFALGTAIPLMVIGVSSAKLLQTEARANHFMKIAGILVLFFVFYNLNVQFNFVDLNKWTNFALTGTTAEKKVGQPSVVSDGSSNATSTSTGSMTNGAVQEIKTTYTLKDDIQPNTFTVKKGQPVSFQVEVKENGQGCMSTIMVQRLYNQPQYLQAGKTITMDFTPTEAGDYLITCAMGVPRGKLKVI